MERTVLKVEVLDDKTEERHHCKTQVNGTVIDIAEATLAAISSIYNAVWESKDEFRTILMATLLMKPEEVWEEIPDEDIQNREGYAIKADLLGMLQELFKPAEEEEEEATE